MSDISEKGRDILMQVTTYILKLEGECSRINAETKTWKLDLMNEFKLRKEIMDERDRLKAELENSKDYSLVVKLKNRVATLEISNAGLMEDMAENTSKLNSWCREAVARQDEHAALYRNRDLWKQKAEKLAEALRKISTHEAHSYEDYEQLVHHPYCDPCIAKEALAAFEWEGK